MAIALSLTSLALLAATVSAMPADPICCMPNVLNGSVTIITGQVLNGEYSKIKIYEHFNLDFTQKKFSGYGFMSKSTIHGDTTNPFHVLIFANTAYSINDEKQTCVKSTIPFPEPVCIPQKASKESRIVYGMGSTSFVADTYKYGSGGVSTEIAVMPKNCLPVNSVITDAEASSYSLQAESLNDVQLTVDEKTFEIPSFCKQAVEEEEGDNPLLDILNHLPANLF